VEEDYPRILVMATGDFTVQELQSDGSYKEFTYTPPNQPLSTTSSPTFGGLTVGGLVVDSYGNIVLPSVGLTGGGSDTLHDSSGLHYGSQVVAMQGIGVSHFSNDSGYLTTEYNYFNQLLNTTNSPTFAGVYLSGGSELHDSSGLKYGSSTVAMQGIGVSYFSNDAGYLTTEYNYFNQLLNTGSSPTFAGLTVGEFIIDAYGNLTLGTTGGFTHLNADGSASFANGAATISNNGILHSAQITTAYIASASGAAIGNGAVITGGLSMSGTLDQTGTSYFEGITYLGGRLGTGSGTEVDSSGNVSAVSLFSYGNLSVGTGPTKAVIHASDGSASFAAGTATISAAGLGTFSGISVPSFSTGTVTATSHLYAHDAGIGWNGTSYNTVLNNDGSASFADGATTLGSSGNASFGSNAIQFYVVSGGGEALFHVPVYVDSGVILGTHYSSSISGEVSAEFTGIIYAPSLYVTPYSYVGTGSFFNGTDYSGENGVSLFSYRDLIDDVPGYELNWQGGRLISITGGDSTGTPQNLYLDSPLILPYSQLNLDGSASFGNTGATIDSSGNTVVSSLAFPESDGATLYDDGGLQYGFQSVAMVGINVSNFANDMGYLTSEYNIFDQSLNTTDSPSFAGLTVTGISTFGGGATIDALGHLSATNFYSMNQAVGTTSSPTFAGVYLNGGSELHDSSGLKYGTSTIAMQGIGLSHFTNDSGYLTTEYNYFNQLLNTTSSPSFGGLTVSGTTSFTDVEVHSTSNGGHPQVWAMNSGGEIAVSVSGTHRASLSFDDSLGLFNYYNASSLACQQLADDGNIYIGNYYGSKVNIDPSCNMIGPASNWVLNADGSAVFSGYAATINVDGSASFAVGQSVIGSDGSASFSSGQAIIDPYGNTVVPSLGFAGTSNTLFDDSGLQYGSQSVAMVGMNVSSFYNDAGYSTGGGDPFDQSLNTTDSPTFASLGVNVGAISLNADGSAGFASGGAGVDGNGTVYAQSGSVSYGGLGYSFTENTNVGFATDGNNLSFYTGSTLALNITDDIKQVRVPADYIFSFSSWTNNNNVADTFFGRAYAGGLYTPGNFIVGSTVDDGSGLALQAPSASFAGGEGGFDSGGSLYCNNSVVTETITCDSTIEIVVGGSTYKIPAQFIS